jgi:pentatricopeptide repeat protein
MEAHTATAGNPQFMTVVSMVLYSLRFEIAFCVCALLGWLVSSSIKQRGQTSMAQKKVQAYAEVRRTPASTAISSSEERSNSLLISYKRCQPDEVIKLFERHRKRQAFFEQPPELLQEIFSLVYSASIRAGAPKSLPYYIGEATKLGVPPTPEQFESVLKMCTSKKAFDEALEALDALGDKDFQGTASTWSCLLFCAVESGQFGRCSAFYVKLRTLREPSCEDFMNMIRFVVHTKQPDRLAPVLKEMRAVSPSPDNITYNRALSVCVSAEQLDMAEQLLEEMQGFEGVCDAITYNTLIKGYARAANVERCFALHKIMLKQGVAPSEVTFGILLDACIGAGMLDRAAKVFQDFQASGCELNAVLYTTLLKGLARAGQLDQSMKIFEQMCASSVVPDLVSYSVLIKVHCDAGKLEVALQLLDRLVKQGLTPDEIVYNNLLTGCAERKSSALGQRLVEDMMLHRVRPTNVTLSIMLKIYVSCKEWDAALEMLNTSTIKFGLPCENRLYVQLLQACIRDRQGKRVMEVCEAMLKKSPPDEATVGRLLQQCISFNMLDSGAELLECLLSCRRVSAKDANALLSMALKKHKASCAKNIIASMQKGNIPIESGLQAASANL